MAPVVPDEREVSPVLAPAPAHDRPDPHQLLILPAPVNDPFARDRRDGLASPFGRVKFVIGRISGAGILLSCHVDNARSLRGRPSHEVPVGLLGRHAALPRVARQVVAGQVNLLGR